MCDCIKEIENKAFDKVKEQKEGEFSKGILTPIHFPIVKNKFMDRQTYSEYEFTLAPKKKDGTIGKPKKQTVSIMHQYCPFCGKKYKKD
jgi:hypothetical protein